MIRVLVIDKTAGLESSHERHQALAAHDEIELSVLGPRYWIENGRPVEWIEQDETRYRRYMGSVFFKDYYARTGYYRGLCDAIRRADPDIVQLLEEPWSISAMQTVLAAALLAPHCVLLFYTWENIYRPWVYPARASGLYAMIDKILHHRSTAAVCATRQAAGVLKQKGYEKPVRVIPYGIPRYFFQNAPRSNDTGDQPVIGYIGRMVYMKGVDLLIRALPQLPDCRLVLIGSGPDERDFRQLAYLMNVEHRIEWVSSIPEHRIPQYLSRMDLLVLPSRTTEGWREQFGRVAVEAMAAGVPVIGSNSGAIPEIIDKAGLLFEEGQVDDLVRQAHSLIHRPTLRRELTEQARRRASSLFTWDRFAREIVDFYKTLIRAAGQPTFEKRDEL